MNNTKKHARNVFLALSTLLSGEYAIAQSTGSELLYGSGLSTINIASGSTHTDVSETLFIGPGNYEINGIWQVYAQQIIIDPAAVISGNGSLHIYDAGDIDVIFTSPTLLDGNNSNNSIRVPVILHNTNGLQLKNQNVDAVLQAAGFVNNPGSTLYIGENLNLAVDGADVWLDQDTEGNLRFTSNAEISNYSDERMVITNNSIVSHVVKDGGGVGFFFPVGISDGDYTPVELAGSENYYVSVVDYSRVDPVIEAPQEGIDRIWHIYGGAATSVMLHHNSPLTDGALYNDATAFITRYQGGGIWSSAANPDFVSTGIHSNSAGIATGIPVSSIDEAWISKSSDIMSPLPVRLLDFNVTKESLSAHLAWATATENNNKGFYIEKSTNGTHWETIAFVTTKAEGEVSKQTLFYSYSDVNPGEGQYFYRLRQTDVDGTFEYSSVKMIQFRTTNEIRIFPNPANNFIHITGVDMEDVISLYSLRGQLLSILKTNDPVRKVNLNNLTAGTYIVVITNKKGEITSMQKILKHP